MNSIWVTAGDGAWCHSLNIIWWAKGSNPFNMIVSASHKVHNKITTTTSSSQSTHHSADCASVGSFRATGPWDISRLWEVHCHGIGCFSLKPRDSSLGLLTTILHDFSHHTQKKKHDNNQDMKTCTGKQTKNSISQGPELWLRFAVEGLGSPSTTVRCRWDPWHCKVGSEGSLYRQWKQTGRGHGFYMDGFAVFVRMSIIMCIPGFWRV